MSRRTATALTALPFALLLALTACTPPGGTSGSGSGSESSGDEETGGGAPTECVSGDWSADLQDLADQMLAQLQSGGSGMFTSATASGSQTLAIDQAGFLGFANDMAFVVTAEIGDGLVMTLTQTHAGGVGADWAWTGDLDTNVMVFENFNDSEYVITNVVDINGTASDMTFPPPDMAAGNVPLTVTCSGDTMTTHPEGSPFTTTWHRQ
jgi:hypothetical protein